MSENTGPQRPQRQRTKATPYTDPTSAKANAAAAKAADKHKKQSHLTPIPISLVLDADAAIVDTSSVEEKDVEKAMAGWRWADSLESGFGTILPKSVGPFDKTIKELMIRQVIDGYQPGTVKPTDPKQWGARISPCVNVVGTYEDIVDAYSDAINRGDASFQIRIRKVWECYDRRFAPACFGGDSEVLMESGTHKLVRHLAVGDSVKVSGGDSAQVTAVWRAQVDRSVPMCSVRGVLLTPDHPVCVDGAWARAGELSVPCEMAVDSVFNFALASSHNMLVRSGASTDVYVDCCTLGMDVPGMPEPLWGTNKIFEHMRTLPGYPNVLTAC